MRLREPGRQSDDDDDDESQKDGLPCGPFSTSPTSHNGSFGFAIIVIIQADNEKRILAR